MSGDPQSDGVRAVFLRDSAVAWVDFAVGFVALPAGFRGLAGFTGFASTPIFGQICSSGHF
jgi:hypothetical protein